LNLEFEALSASGVPPSKIDSYQGKFDLIQKKLTEQVLLSNDTLIRSRQIFEWLWKEKPDRYKRKGPFRLNEVIDLQCSEDSLEVGNCLGLTVFYNCLLIRMDIDAGAFFLEHAFDRGPHVLTRISIGDLSIDVENIFQDGFDYRGHQKNPTRIRWGDRELVADIYLSLGNKCFERNRFREALTHYEKAILLNPEYEKAELNRTIILEKLAENGR
jgi:tetratricopeptide (TPR) repeat protein